MLLPFTGNFESFMQKEIFEQPESVVNTMRGRICFDTNKGEHWSHSLPSLSYVKDVSRTWTPWINIGRNPYRTQDLQFVCVNVKFN